MQKKARYSCVKFSLLEIFMVLIGVLGRLIPHPTNVSPFVGMSLFVGKKLSCIKAFFVMLVAAITSDFGLALLFGYPFFGYWTLFTYSGFAAIIFLGSRFSLRSWHSLFLYIFCSSLGFWVWTNFGVWLTSGLYSNNFAGLSACYMAALPFLSNSLFGDFLWGGIIFSVHYLVRYRKFIKLRDYMYKVNN